MPYDPVNIMAEICRFTQSRHVPLGAVRAQKLFYLLECEFYAWENARLTDLSWIFYHYGPWSPDLADILQTRFKVEDEILPDGRPFHRISPPERVSDAEPPPFPPDVRGMFERVMDTWAARPLPEVLDYVYFQTAPMQGVERRQILEFKKIAPARSARFPINPYALMEPEQKTRMRQILAAWASRIREAPKPPAVRHEADDLLDEALQAIAREEATPEIDIDIAIPNETADTLKEDRNE